MNREHTTRRTIIILIIIIVAAVALSFLMMAFRQKTNANALVVRQDQKLLFNDEFKGDQVDTSKWNFCYDNYSYKYEGCVNYGNWEDEWYKASQVTQAEGNLVLTAKRQKTRGDNRYKAEQDYRYVSGMVSTGAKDQASTPKWEGKYGYYEARILVPEGQALWPAFWLLPTDRDWPPEIDIMEVLGQKPKELLTTYHWKDDAGKPAIDSSTFKSEKKLSSGWHTYGAEWQKGEIKWYIDNKLIKTVKSKNVPDKKMQLIMNLAVGGTLPGEVDDTTPDTALMLVDYVRVYDKK